MRRVFVTGGSGFVGRNLLAALQRRGVTALALARSDAAAAACAGQGARVVRGDLADVNAMAAGMAGCEVVFHAAAHVLEWDAPAVFQRINVTGTANTLLAARQAKVPRFVHVGTEAVLVGGGPIVQVDETRPLPEQPLPGYPASKAAAERLVRAATGLEAVVVRPRLIWGAGDSSLLPQFAAAVHAGRFRWISGGRYLTSTCHVDNVVEGMLLAAERGRHGEAYFLSDGAPVEFRGFVAAMLATQGIDAGTGSLPRGLARAVAVSCEAISRASGYRWRPPLTRVALKLMGEEVTVVDAKARAELGYVGARRHEDGFRAMREAQASTAS
ncbi:NAD-dependent epimerase/dehydratase family protein [Nannocystis sp.]|uniref:NAD-dependent epimerase/dehydratase family protein n=1 Tax=Nannocystis sp. TaxID=1962667 RepID=UPI0024285360|nr:NAD-dependent epimerase/dehydratase family protein [Nannocystis sp.]MBK7827473.1 NAD-dependent epimerase/dehydratase family protein [Nannocystis sp.]MBK9756355.1 NAD-dependent epimerase/dehydratase family protein [Nannocystis sp.]